MNIIQVATINKPVTPTNGYGPIETVIYYIDKGLHTAGHRSIVACSSDSSVTGEHYATVPRSLGDYRPGKTPGVQAQIALHLRNTLVRAKQPDIDIVHMHEWFERVYDGSFNPAAPIVMTLHVPGDRSGIAEFREQHPEMFATPCPQPLHAVAISEFQRRQYSGLIPVVRTIPHGIDADDYPFNAEPASPEYLFSIGRITADKGQDTAVAVARQSGKKLIIAGCIQDKSEDRDFFQSLKKSFALQMDLNDVPVTPDYFDRIMRPILSSDKQVIYVGELRADAAKHWYRHASATLFPIRWGEPFGIVLIESMASGTPVVAFGEGAVPEIVKHGDTGFVVDSVEAMVDAVGRITEISREACHRHVRAHFSMSRMAASYAKLYGELAESQPHAKVTTRRSPLPLAPP